MLPALCPEDGWGRRVPLCSQAEGRAPGAPMASTSTSNYPPCEPPGPISQGIQLAVWQHSSTYCFPIQQKGPKHRFWLHFPAKPCPLCVSRAVPSRINQTKPRQAHTFTSPAAPHLFEGQQHELLCLGHLHEVLEDVLVGRLEEVAAGVRVGKAPDPQAVGWVELAQEELAASIPHTIELKQAGSGKKCLAVEKNGEKRSFQGKETPFSPSSHCRSMAEEV